MNDPNTPSGNTPKTPADDRDFAELSKLIRADLQEQESAEKSAAALDEARLEAELAELKPQLPPPPQPKKRRSCLGVLMVLLLLVVAGIGGGGFWLYRSFTKPITFEADQLITIKQGASAQAIVTQLYEAGIVKQPSLFALYLRASGKGGQLKPGVYRFTSPISAMQAIDKIARGEIAFERFTIPEGFNRFDIAETLATKTKLASEQEFLRLMNNTRGIARLSPQARNLEGYLFPDTYNYTPTASPEELISLMVNRFEDIFTPQWTTRASQLGLSVHQVITLASIIEEEARVAEDRPKISSVIHNRLKIRMPLACDPTFIYAAQLANDYDGNPNQPRHRQRLSPYNTYIFSGLPPGPIASPGKASIEAALYPAETQYLYFVANGIDGRHLFSRTAAEHEAAVAQYRRNLREQRQ